LFLIVVSIFCSHLAIGHLVDRLDAEDASARSFVGEALFEPPFASPGPNSRIDSALRTCNIISS